MPSIFVPFQTESELETYPAGCIGKGEEGGLGYGLEIGLGMGLTTGVRVTPLRSKKANGQGFGPSIVYGLR
jgi:hypothetical protein